MQVILLAIFLLAYLWLGIIATGTELAFLWPGTLGLGLAAVLALFARRREWIKPVSPLCALTALSLLVVLGLRATASEAPYFGRMDLLLILPAFAVYALFAVGLRRPGYRMVAVGMLFVLAVGNVLVAYYQRVNDPGFCIIPGYERVIVSKGTGGFFNLHTHLAAFLEVPMMFAAALVLFGRMTASWRLVCTFVWFACAAGIVVSLSRSGVIAVASGMIVLGAASLYLARRLHAHLFRRLAITGGIAGVVLVGAFVALSLGALGDRFGDTGLVDDEGKIARAGRLGYWQAAIDQVASAPLLGTGSRSFGYRFYRHFPEEFWVGTPSPDYVHNEYLQLAAEYGLIAAVIMAAFLLLHLGSGLRHLAWYRSIRYPETGRSRSNSLALTLGAFAALATQLVHAAFDFQVHLLSTAALSALCLGMLASSGRQEGSGGRAGAVSAVAIRGVLVAVGAVLLVMGWRFIREDDAMRRADHAMFRGNTPTAIAALHPYENSGSHNMRIYKTLALIRFNEYFDADLPDVLLASYLERALAGFEASLQVHPNDFWAMVYAARCEIILGALDSDAGIRRGRYERAEAYLDDAVVWAPLRYEPHTWLGELRQLQSLEAGLTGKPDLALQLARESLASFEFAVSRISMRMRRRSDGQLAALRGARDMRAKVAELSGPDPGG